MVTNWVISYCFILTIYLWVARNGKSILLLLRTRWVKGSPRVILSQDQRVSPLVSNCVKYNWWKRKERTKRWGTTINGGFTPDFGIRLQNQDPLEPPIREMSSFETYPYQQISICDGNLWYNRVKKYDHEPLTQTSIHMIEISRKEKGRQWQ